VLGVAKDAVAGVAGDFAHDSLLHQHGEGGGHMRCKEPSHNRGFSGGKGLGSKAKQRSPTKETGTLVPLGTSFLN
jgi:hypothetical protein